ncbi:MAG: hypothetical protein ACI8SR_002665 [Oceanicoccus sp.]|jgi:hypothetical protein
MYFKKTLLGLAIVGSLQGCNWDDKYQAVDCSGEASPDVIDCRTEGKELDITEGNSGIDDGTGSIISFARDTTSLLTLSAAGSESWSSTHADQIDLLVSASQDQILVGSKFHNYLRSFQSDTAGQVVALAGTGFLDVSGERYAVDAISGASEQVFNGLDLHTTGNQTVLMARAEKYDSASAAIGVGLYIDTIDALFTLPDRDFASQDGANFISYSAIRASTVSSSGHALAVTGSDRNVKTYLKGEYSTPNQTKRLGIRGSTIAYSFDEKALYVGGLALAGAVVSLDSETLAEHWSINLSDKPLALLPVASGGVVAVLSSGTSAFWLSESGDESTLVNISMAQQATAATMNQLGTIFAVADTEQGIEAISLATGKRAYIKHSAAVQSLVMDGFGTIWVMSKGYLQGYQLPVGFE